jgi:hypothetical protein
MPKVFIEIKNGFVKQITTDVYVEVVVLDHDLDETKPTTTIYDDFARPVVVNPSIKGIVVDNQKCIRLENQVKNNKKNDK